ncbi:MAG: hypothetical protein Q8M16_02665 [Pirellulaceae bacterium]|nr:hypothetical protein [Pirellulaceae bacterium]
MTLGTRRSTPQSDPIHRAAILRRLRWWCFGPGTLLWASMALVSGFGCQGLLSTGSLLSGKFGPGPNATDSDSEFVLVDRTGQSVPEHASDSANRSPAIATQATTNAVLEAPLSQPSPVAMNSQSIGDIELSGPTTVESNIPSRTAATSTGQSFRVQVVDNEPSVREQNLLDPAQTASAQAMVQAIQQVTQQGLGRLANNRSDSAASPALANLLMDEVQNSTRSNQAQQASLALQNLETDNEVPAFDLSGNRPLTTVNPDSPNTGGTTASIDSSGSVVASNTPAVQIAWRPAIQQAIRSIEQSVSQAKEPQEKQNLEIYLRLLQLIAHDPDEAVRNIESLPKHRQNFWREQIFALSQIIQAPESDQELMFVNHSRQATKALAHLQNAIEALKNEATLQIRQVQFCQEIRSFGDYDLARSTLVASGDPMLIYCEVFNYSAQRLNDSSGDHFQTSLVPSYVILDSQQQPVSQKEFPAVRDRCRSRRQDFYLVLQVEVPNLPPGKYHLQVNVEDLAAGKIAPAAPLTFQVRPAR